MNANITAERVEELRSWLADKILCPTEDHCESCEKATAILAILRSHAASLASPASGPDDPTLPWRQLLWLRHGHFQYLYGDDGEMQCNHPDCVLDFKRDSAAEVEERFRKASERALLKETGAATVGEAVQQIIDKASQPAGPGQPDITVQGNNGPLSGQQVMEEDEELEFAFQAIRNITEASYSIPPNITEDLDKAFSVFLARKARLSPAVVSREWVRNTIEELRAFPATIDLTVEKRLREIGVRVEEEGT